MRRSFGIWPLILVFPVVVLALLFAIRTWT